MLGKPDTSNPHPLWLQAMHERGYDIPTHKPRMRLRYKAAIMAAIAAVVLIALL